MKYIVWIFLAFLGSISATIFVYRAHKDRVSTMESVRNSCAGDISVEFQVGGMFADRLTIFCDKMGRLEK